MQPQFAVWATVDLAHQLVGLLAQRALVQVVGRVLEHQVERQRHKDRGDHDRHEMQNDRAADDRAKANQLGVLADHISDPAHRMHLH